MAGMLLNLPFPTGGLNEAVGYKDQPQGTCVDCRNVRGFDPETGRNRGAQRPGLSKYVSTAHSSGAQVQHITHHVGMNTGAISATSVGTRTITPLAVVNGNVEKFTSSGGWSTATSGSSALSSSAPFVQSAPMFGVLYFADGVSTKQWTASTNTVATWTASAGSLPTDSSNYPRLICTWRGRIVQAGIKTDGHNWFMSACGDATDWDYAPATITECSAVAGNNSAAGYVTDDIITSLIPYNDHYLLMGGDHSINLMDGDPQAGGRIVQVTSNTGIAWGDAWCRYKNMIFFAGSNGGLWAMTVGSEPERISNFAVEERLADIDYDTTKISLVWNDREQGFHAFYTPLDGSASEHIFYDLRNKAFWIDKFTEDANMNPTAVHLFDGPSSTDRAILLGSQDGYIRKWDVSADDDDGQPIKSYVFFGPIQGQNGEEVQASEMTAVMGENTNSVKYEVYTGDGAEEAKAQTRSRLDGTWKKGRNRIDNRRSVGNAIYVKVKNETLNNHWSMERLTMRVQEFGSEKID